MKINAIFFGAGSLYLNNKERIHDCYNILAFIDNDPRKKGTYIDNIIVYSPNEITNLNYEIIVISSSFEGEIYSQLQRLNIPDEKIIFLRTTLNVECGRVLSNVNTSTLFYKPTGENGDNLSIVILSYNRVDMTIRLLLSISDKLPSFKGEIVVFDNGSKPNELDELKFFLRNFKFSYVLIENNENFGVAKGRNCAVKYATNEWVFFLDNDIYFTENPLLAIHETILKFNTPYINLPLLNNDGNTVYSFGGNITTNHGCVEVSPFIPEGFPLSLIRKSIGSEIIFGTFLFGGTAIYHRNSFIDQGGFDEDLFIGFEDLVFSISLMRKGIRIANIPRFYMIHDHARKTDRDYNKTRYDAKVIKESASVIYEKHGVNLYSNEVDKWLSERCK